jgi:hypothetical protein
MIENTFAPGESKGRVFAAREDGRVFDGNAALIVIPIQGPRPKLAARELAVMHEEVKRVLVVIPLFTNGVKAGDELRFRERRLFA